MPRCRDRSPSNSVKTAPSIIVNTLTTPRQPSSEASLFVHQIACKPHHRLSCTRSSSVPIVCCVPPAQVWPKKPSNPIKSDGDKRRGTLQHLSGQVLRFGNSPWAAATGTREGCAMMMAGALANPGDVPAVIKSREPGAGSREPGAGSREPGAGSREPGAGSREPGAGSREPGAGSREPGAGSREPGAGSREPGAISTVCARHASADACRRAAGLPA